MSENYKRFMSFLSDAPKELIDTGRIEEGNLVNFPALLFIDGDSKININVVFDDQDQFIDVVIAERLKKPKNGLSIANNLNQQFRGVTFATLEGYIQLRKTVVTYSGLDFELFITELISTIKIALQTFPEIS